jgi:hypothetical protein
LEHDEQQPAQREQKQRGGNDGGAPGGTLLQQGELAGKKQAGDEAGVEEPPAESLVPALGAAAAGLSAQTWPLFGTSSSNIRF